MENGMSSGVQPVFNLNEKQAVVSVVVNGCG